MNNNEPILNSKSSLLGRYEERLGKRWSSLTYSLIHSGTSAHWVPPISEPVLSDIPLSESQLELNKDLNKGALAVTEAELEYIDSAQREKVKRLIKGLKEGVVPFVDINEYLVFMDRVHKAKKSLDTLRDLLTSSINSF